MRTLIVGDIHNRIEDAENAIEKIKPDRTIFTGDYFDFFGDGKYEARRTANWLKKSIHTPNRIHIIGNHDLSYINKHFFCPGWKIEKHNVVDKIISKEDWHKFKFNFWVDDFLVSHAGFSNWSFHAPNDTNEAKHWVEKNNNDALKCLINNQNHPYFNQGTARGGMSIRPGIIWCDFRYEFSCMSFNQIFGHTPDIKIRSKKGFKSINFCVDSVLQEFLVINSGEPTVYAKEKNGFSIKNME